MSYMRRGIAVVLALLLIMGMGAPLATASPDAVPANAGPITAVLSTSKKVADAELTPGQQTIFTLTAGCTSGTTLCEGAVLTDLVPAPLVVENVQVSGQFAHDASVSLAGEGNREVTVTFASKHAANGAIGLKDGSTTTILVTVRLPEDLSAEFDGTKLLNTVDLTATNANPKAATATVGLTVPTTFGANISKAWSQPNFVAGIGGENTVALTNIKNTSNVGATSLTIVEPSGGSNPFDVVGFAGFGNIVFPAGADKIQVNVLTAEGKREGTAAATAALPDGVTNEQVKGLEFIFTSSENTEVKGGIHADGAAGEITFKTTVPVAAVAGTINNEASITAQTPKGDSEPKTAQAPFTITDAEYSVSAQKSFTSSAILKGATSQVHLGGTNTSDQQLTSMTITEPKAGTPNPFTANPGMTFTGFSPTPWPAGADTATLVVGDASYTLIKGADNNVIFPAEVVAATLTGFSLTYTGALAPSTQVMANFTVTGDTIGTIPNTVGVTGTAPDGAKDPGEAQAEATLSVTEPKVLITPAKSFSGNVQGNQGDTTSARLRGTVASGTDAPVPSITLIDEFTPAMISDWKANKVTVSAVAGQTVTVQALVGGLWVDVPSNGTVAALPEGATGVKVTFTKTDGGNFAVSNFVEANIEFELTKDVATGTKYTNVLTIAGQEGVSPPAVVETNNTLQLATSKAWLPNRLVVTDTVAQPQSRLSLAVRNTSLFAIDSLKITDPVAGTNPFDLLDLTAVSALELPQGTTSATLTLTFADNGTESFVAGSAAGFNALITAEKWAAANGFTLETIGAVRSQGRLAIDFNTMLRTHTRGDGTPVADALKALETAYTIPNKMTGTAQKAGKDPLTKDAAADVKVQTTDSIVLQPQLVKTFDAQSGTMFGSDGKIHAVKTTLTVKNGGDRPDVVVFEEKDPTFFNAFDFGGWGAFNVLEVPGNGNVKAEISYFSGGVFTGNEGDVTLEGGAWSEPVTFTLKSSGELVNAANAGMPDGISAADVQGFRLKYYTVNGDDLPQVHQPATKTAGQSVMFNAVPRYKLHTGEVNATDGIAINPGEQAASTVNNTASVTTKRDGATSNPVEDNADFVFVEGVASAAVSKTDKTALNTTTFAGGLINYTLVLKNTGTEPLTNPVFTDLLPVDDGGAVLVYKPEEEAASFSKSPGTVAITTDPEEVTTSYEAEGSAPSVSFSFPQGSFLLPGESYTVTLPLYVRAGMPPTEGIVNNLTVDTDQLTVRATPALVKVLVGQSYEARKLVREVLEAGQQPTGVHNVLGEDRSCDDFGDGFYRYPCVVETKPGADAEWKITVANTGNVPTSRLELVDVFPYVGDHMISPDAVELARRTEWLPTFKQLLEFDVPEGATATVKYLIGEPGSCVSSGVKHSANPWGEGCADTLFTETLPNDVSTVIGFKVTFDFETPLPPLGMVELRFLTTSATKMPAGVEDLAPAWNTFAYVGTANIGNDTQFWQQEPNQTGITFRSIPDKVSVGDYVWVDTDRDGVQGDPVAEPGIKGVVLILTGPDGGPVTDVYGAVVKPTTTDEKGAYIFENLPVLADDQSYTVTIDQEASKEPLAPYIPTVETDPDVQGYDPELDSSTGSATSTGLTQDGDHDPSLDFGFVLPMVSVGDYVWVDTDRDGVQGDPAVEPGIKGVVLVLTNQDGKSVTDVFGNEVAPVTTDKDGKYLFLNLPVLAEGQSYTVSIDTKASEKALAPYVPTVTGQGERTNDSSDGSATTDAAANPLTANGQHDPTLDFGFVLPRVSVGDYVWVDTNGDGRQDTGEPGIKDVILVLTGTDGKAVTDVFGHLVGPVSTDRDGKYTFENLPVLPAGQFYTVSIDRAASRQALAPYQPTVAGQGEREGDSSDWTVASGDLLNDGDRDASLDFGFTLIPTPVDPLDPVDPPVTDPPVTPVDPPVTPTVPPVTAPPAPIDSTVAPPTASAHTASAPATPAADELSNTGYSGAVLMGVGLLLTLLGGGAVALTTRRRRSSPARH